MSVVRITKEFTMEMAHALAEYEGKCSNIHGHSYKLSVTLKGEPISEAGNNSLGMVMDFADLKDIVKENVIRPFDHVLVLKDTDKRADLASENTRVLKVPYQPTCENLLLDFVSRLQPFFKEELRLHHVRLRETATSYADWYADDN